MLHNLIFKEQTASTLPDTTVHNLRVMPSREPAGVSSLLPLATLAPRRCSTFFAEAAVLVLVFGILDYFMMKGRIELPWIVGALGISVGLLAASIATDDTAPRR